MDITLTVVYDFLQVNEIKPTNTFIMRHKHVD